MEAATEKILEKALGDKVDIDGDEVTIKGDNGEEVTIGGGQRPDTELAKKLPEFTKGTVVSAVTEDNSVMIFLEKVNAGVFWMKTKLDTGEYLKELLKGVPVQMNFDAGGEGVCDYINIILMNGFERQSMGGSCTMPDKNGETLTPSGDTLAARGSFIAEATDAYLDVKARGAAGETVEHQDNKAGSTEIDFVIHVEPDPDYKATERKVTIHFSTSEGMAVTLDGVLRRLSGYSEDLKAYTSQGKREEILNKHLE